MLLCYGSTSFPGAQMVKNTCNAGDLGAVPGLGRAPGEGNPLQYSCLENSHRQRSLVGCSPWGHKESDTTEVTEHTCVRQGSQASSFGEFQSQASPTTDSSNVIGFAGPCGPNGKATCSATWAHCKSHSNLKVFWVT